MTPHEEKQHQRLNVTWSTTLPKPREVFIDLTNHCNHTCFFCANHKLVENKFLDKDLMFRVMRECRELGVTDVALYATGEPFFRKDLAEIVKFTKDIGFSYIFTTTNGALATPVRVKEVIDAGLDSLKFSINAGNRKSYLVVHGKDDFDQVIENLKWCHQYRVENKLPIKLYVSMVPTYVTKGEWEQLLALIGDCIDNGNLRHCSTQGGNMPENNRTEKIDPKNLLGSLPPGLAVDGKCPDPFSRVMITSDGYLSLCVVDYQNNLCVADLKKVSLKEAWNNAYAQKLRASHLEGKLDNLICDNCLNNNCASYKPLRPELARNESKPARVVGL